MKNNKLIYILLAILTIWLLTLTLSKNTNTSSENKTIVNEYNISGISTDFTKIVEDNKSSVVTITADGVVSSGFVYSQVENKVYIVSTYHGLDKAFNINVYFDNNYCVSGKLIGHDIFGDVGIIEVEIPYDVKAITIGDGATSRAGEFVITMGTPLNLDYKGSVELGMISSQIDTIDNSIIFNGKSYNYYTDMIQLSCKLNNGYSGAPIINMNSEVIGMVTMNYKDSLCFILPINEIEIIANKIINGEDYLKTQYGLKGNYVSEMENYVKTNLNIPIDVFNGLYISKIDMNGFGYVSGLRTGDIILSINNVEIVDYNSYLMCAYSGEKVIELKVLRNGEEIILTGSIDD